MQPRPQPGSYSLKPGSSIRDAIKSIDRSLWISIALIVDEYGHLINTISDGDIRRGVLAGIELESPVSLLLPIKASTPHPNPTVASLKTKPAELLRIMREKSVRQIPLVDSDGRVVDVATLQELLPEPQPRVDAVIMAGGFGTRLRPLTENVPKPMLDINGRPIIEHIVDQLKESGICDIKVTTHFKPEVIQDHFGDGQNFGVSISYLNEETPLGTAGSLGLMPRPSNTTLIVNGDVFTKVDFRSLIAYHQEHAADMTIAVTRYEVELPYGVVESTEHAVKAIKEKPKMTFLVNSGIYLLEPSVFSHVPIGKAMQMTDLINNLISEGKHLVSFPIFEEWIDIGRHADYLRAQKATDKTVEGCIS